MKPLHFPQANVVMGKGQEEYQPLPAFHSGYSVVSCWGLTWKERLKVLLTGRIFFTVMVWGEKLQPQLPSVDNPVGDRK